MNKLLSLCFLALSILTATSDNPAFSFFSSPADLSSLSELSSPSSSYTEPFQEFTAGVFTLSIPSSFEKKCDQYSYFNVDHTVCQPAEFLRITNDSKKPTTLQVLVRQNETSVSFNTLEENLKVINAHVGMFCSESPSYKYIDGYLVGFVSEKRSYTNIAVFAISTGTDLLLVHIRDDELDDVFSIRDQLMDTLKIDTPQQ